jgi:CRISPR-associated protein Cas1
MCGVYYMKQNAKSDKPFTLNSHVLERVKAWEKLLKEEKEKVPFFASNG